MQAHSTLYLSGLRGFAAFLAVNAHDAWLYQNGDYSKTFGFAGVDLFFVLSSFLLTRGLYHQMISFINQEKSFSQWIQMLKIYFIRRFARIYPFFVYVVLLNIILAQMFKTDTALSNYFTWFGGRENFINISWKIVTFMEAPAFFWTLVIEVQYYFLIPVIVAVAVFSKKFWWIPVTILLLISTIMNFNVKRVNDNATIFEHCWTFLTGSCFALFVARLEELKFNPLSLTKLQRFIIDLATVVFLLFTIDYAWGIPFFPHNDTVNYRKPYFESKFLSLAMSILISKEFFFPTGISKCFEWNVLLFLGEISFPWYLTHVIFWQYRDWSIQVNHYDTRSFRFCLGIFAAWILHVFVEKPISKLTSHYCRYLSSENNNVKDSLLPVTQKAA